MPRYSRSILSSILQGKPAPGEPERGPTLRTVRNTPVWCTVKLILPLTIDASGICEFGIGKREGHGASSLRLLLGLDAPKRAIGSGSYSDKPASSRWPIVRRPRAPRRRTGGRTRPPPRPACQGAPPQKALRGDHRRVPRRPQQARPLNRRLGRTPRPVAPPAAALRQPNITCRRPGREAPTPRHPNRLHRRRSQGHLI